MQYGYFNDLNKEYVITDPKTPVKWINYIGSLEFGGFVDHTGGSLICKGDPATNRIIKYISQLPSSEFKGETLYVRIKAKEAFTLFSPYYVPTLDQYQLYECHVGLGYSRIISEFYGIRADVTIFVPVGSRHDCSRDRSRVIRDIRLTNLRASPVEIDLIPVVEYTHFDALKQLTNADWVPHTMQSRCIKGIDGMKLLIQYAFMNRERCINYFTSNHPASSFETDRRSFLGSNEYGTWESPHSLNNIELGNSEAVRGDNIAALMHHLGVIQPGQSRRVITQLGQCEDILDELEAIQKFRNERLVDSEFEKLKLFWEDYLEKVRADTPDKGMNTMLNIHNPRQCYITKQWSRYLSLYQLGYGSSRGIGFRDSCQDVMGIMSHAPDEARELLEKLLSVQKQDGSAMHQFNPATMIASAGDSEEMEDRPKYYSDDHLWSILAVCAYLKETGDMDFLKKDIPFYEKDRGGVPLDAAAVLEHMERAIAFTAGNTGYHGLPLLGFADWNDTVNLPGGAESIFTADLFGKALMEMLELMDFLGNKEKSGLYRQYYETMKNRVNEHAWDGEWYVRYFDHLGKPLGSSLNEYGKIYVNSQSWAVISGFAPRDRADRALGSVNKLLNTKNGIKLSHPGYNGYDPEKGGITTYPPGAKENGGIFLHCNPWVMIAEAINGNGKRAFTYYSQINPVYKNNRIEEYECEPYCYPQNILGDEHPLFGLARNSWLSGTASWVYQAAVKYILGIDAAYGGLTINPCIPEDWNSFKVIRHFRGAIYDIRVKNPENISKGVRNVMLDGIKLSGNLVPVCDDGRTHLVEVIMGT